MSKPYHFFRNSNAFVSTVVARPPAVIAKNRNLRDFAVDLSRKHDLTNHVLERLKEIKADGINDPKLNQLILDASSHLEIANIKRVNPGFVRTANHRIKKKLGIPEEDKIR